jgi:hypothetical protein
MVFPLRHRAFPFLLVRAPLLTAPVGVVVPRLVSAAFHSPPFLNVSSSYKLYIRPLPFRQSTLTCTHQHACSTTSISLQRFALTRGLDVPVLHVPDLAVLDSCTLSLEAA